jgi:acyl carrier protein
MQRLTIIEKLKRYIAQDVLAGKDIGLDETTPLLEWGIMNSLEIVRLLSFIRKQFAIDIPADKLVADSFTSVSSVADLVLESVPAGAIN